MEFEFPGEAEIIEGMVLRVDKTEQFLKVCLVESKINKTIRNELGKGKRISYVNKVLIAEEEVKNFSGISTAYLFQRFNISTIISRNADTINVCVIDKHILAYA